MVNQNINKKALAEKIINKLNSPEYISMLDLITRDGFCPELLVWFPGKKDGWISDYEDINPGGKESKNIVRYDELEKNDWEEITSLIEQRNQKRRQVYEERKKNIETKLKSQANLYYHWGKNVKYKGDIGSIEWKGMRKYLQLQGGENDLFIAENHPVLDNFSFQVGFFLVDTEKQVERSPRGSLNKFVETGDKITITPYDWIINKPIKNTDKKIIGVCEKCGADYRNIESWYYTPVDESRKSSWEKLDWFCGDCWQIEEKNYRAKSNRQNTVHKNEPKKNNLGDEHWYYFENGRWISVESGTPDPNITSPERKSECDTCHKKLGREHGGSDNFYIMKRYHGKPGNNGLETEFSGVSQEVKRNKGVVWNCLDCYPKKEQEYLQNYSAIYERFTKDGDIDYRLIKAEWIDCYSGKKDQNGQILEQKNCSHCQPWKQKEEKSKPEKLTKEIINWLIQYFQENKIQEISLKNGELVIRHNNNNEIVSAEKLIDSPDYKNIQNLLLTTGKNSLELKKLKELNNSPQNSTPNSPDKTKYIPWIAGGIFLVALLGIIIWAIVREPEKKPKIN